MSVFSSILPGNASINISLDQPFVFVQPTNHFGQNGPTAILHGSVILSFHSSKPRKFKSLTVSLVGQVDIGFPDGTGLNHTFLEKHVDVGPPPQAPSEANHKEDQNGKTTEFLIEEGENAFEFSFILPSSTAPTERSHYGRTRYKLKAKAVPSGMGPTLTTSRPVHVIAIPPPILTENIDTQVRHFTEELGIVNLRHSSPSLTVAGVILFEVTMPSPPTQISIKHTEGYLLQQFTILSPKDAAVKVEPKPRKVRLIRVGIDVPDLENHRDPQIREKVTTLEAGKEWIYKNWMRIPDDNSIRPTTMAGSETSIRVSHKLVTEMQYQPLSEDGTLGPLRQMTSTKDITIASCVCLHDSVALPPYTPSPSTELPAFIVPPAVTNPPSTASSSSSGSQRGRSTDPTPLTPTISIRNASSVSPARRSPSSASISASSSKRQSFAFSHHTVTPSASSSRVLTPSTPSGAMTPVDAAKGVDSPQSHSACICGQRLAELLTEETRKLEDGGASWGGSERLVRPKFEFGD